jgi:hypothetical protein
MRIVEHGLPVEVEPNALLKAGRVRHTYLHIYKGPAERRSELCRLIQGIPEVGEERPKVPRRSTANDCHHQQRRVHPPFRADAREVLPATCSFLPPFLPNLRGPASESVLARRSWNPGSIPFCQRPDPRRWPAWSWGQCRSAPLRPLRRGWR